MPNPLILHDFYTPKVGEGAPMLEALRKKNEIWLAQGLPGFSFLKPFDGPHNAIVTVQNGIVLPSGSQSGAHCRELKLVGL